MGIAAWKKIEQSRPAWAVKLLYKRLAGKELWLGRDLRLATVTLGGWELIATGLGTNSVVYSLGIGEDLVFDLALIERYGCHVYAFDPTPSTVRWVERQVLPGQFHFRPWAVAASDGQLTLYPRVRGDGSSSEVMYTFVADDGDAAGAVEVPAYSVPSIAKQFGHERIDILKIDIEGAEFGVLEGMLDMAARPRQLLVEFHHRFAGISKEDTAAIIAKLRAVGYRIFALSRTGREVSFVLDPTARKASAAPQAR